LIIKAHPTRQRKHFYYYEDESVYTTKILFVHQDAKDVSFGSKDSYFPKSFELMCGYVEGAQSVKEYFCSFFTDTKFAQPFLFDAKSIFISYQEKRVLQENSNDRVPFFISEKRNNPYGNNIYVKPNTTLPSLPVAPLPFPPIPPIQRSTQLPGIGRGPLDGTVGSALPTPASETQRETPQLIVGYSLSVVASLGRLRACHAVHWASASAFANERLTLVSSGPAGYSMLTTG
jgi:hypothetical protein